MEEHELRQKARRSMLPALPSIPLAHGALGYGDDVIAAIVGIILIVAFVRSVLSARRSQVSNANSNSEKRLPPAVNDLDNDIRRLD